MPNALVMKFDTNNYSARNVIKVLDGVNSIYEMIIYTIEHTARDGTIFYFDLDVFREPLTLTSARPIGGADQLDVVNFRTGSMEIKVRASSNVGTQAIGILARVLNTQRIKRDAAKAKAAKATGEAIAQAIENIKSLDDIHDRMLKARLRDEIIKTLDSLPSLTDIEQFDEDESVDA